MPAEFLIDIGLGLLGAGGQERANRQNLRLAREQMRFQNQQARAAETFSERMSNTAYQRAVADARAAGLNPALAYGHSASSPSGVSMGGSSATVNDVVSSGISSALRAREARTALAQAKENLQLTRAQRHKTESEEQEVLTRTKELRRQWDFNVKTQPYQEKLTAAEAALRQYMLPAAKNTADYESMLGRLSPGLASAKTLSEIIKTLRRY